jgi:hypothetical protein
LVLSRKLHFEVSVCGIQSIMSSSLPAYGLGLFKSFLPPKPRYSLQ